MKKKSFKELLLENGVKEKWVDEVSSHHEEFFTNHVDESSGYPKFKRYKDNGAGILIAPGVGIILEEEVFIDEEE
jgi:hypothetical protein